MRILLQLLPFAFCVVALPSQSQPTSFVERAQHFRRLINAGDYDAARTMMGKAPRRWFDAREGEGSPWQVGGTGPWGAWDDHFHGSTEEVEWVEEGNTAVLRVREMNDYFRLLDRPPVTNELVYYFDAAGKIDGLLIRAVGDRPQGRTDAFLSWARKHEPEEIDYLMPGGDIDPSGDRPQRYRALLERWRRDLGLPLGPSDTVIFHQEVAWSPDGKQIAYSAMAISKSRWEGQGFGALKNTDYEIFVMNSDGSADRRLTWNPGYDLWISWSPDGNEIAFGSDRDGNTDIYVMSPHGSGTRRLTRDEGEDSGPAYSPDGASIAFMSKQGGHWHLWLMNRDGSNRRQLTDGPADDWNPRWSPDGTQLVFYSNRNHEDAVFVMPVDNSAPPRAIARGVYPDWSPTGSEILYGSRGLYRIGLEDTEAVLVATKAEFGRWSPDGSRIAYVAGDAPATVITIVDRDGGHVQHPGE